MKQRRIYLAGPDVFLPNAGQLADKKRRLCLEYGFIGVSPVDNQTDLSGLEKWDAALRIALANEETIRGCDLMIAHTTPFRGYSADAGTAYEMGYARALGQPVFAYSNDSHTMLERIKRDPTARVTEHVPGQFEDSDRMMIEDFDCYDNLMLVGAVYCDGVFNIVQNPVPLFERYTNLAGFEECLRLAARKFKTG